MSDSPSLETRTTPASDDGRNQQKPRGDARSPLNGLGTLERVTLNRDAPGILSRYGFALLAAAGALALTQLFMPVFGRHTWLFFFAGVAVAAWAGGRRASMLTMLLAVISTNYFYLAPIGSIKVGGRNDIAYMLMFAPVAVLVGFLIASLREARQVATLRAARLEEQTTELEQQVEEAQVLTEELEETNETLFHANATARQAGEEATRVQSHVKAILDSLPDAATAFDSEWRYVYMNRVAADFLRAGGKDPDAALGRKLWDVLEGVDENLRANLERTMGSSTSTEFQSHFAPLDRWFENRVARTLDGIVVLSRDITDRKKSEAEQHFLTEASDALYSSLDLRETLDTVATLAIKWVADGSAIDIVRPTGGTDRIATASRNAESAALAAEIERRYPLSPDSPHGFPHVIRTGEPEITAEITDGILRAVSQNEEHYQLFRRLEMRSVMTVPLIGRDGVLGAITFVALGHDGRKPFNDRDLVVAQELARRASLAIENARSFQEVQRARAEAEHANRAKLEFLTTMSHELRTPLNAIAGYAELIALGVRGPVTPQQTEDLTRIQRSQRYLLALINDLLNFAKIETGKVDFNYREVLVSEAMAGMEALIAPQVMAKGLHYRFRCDIDRDVAITADSDKLQQIILNLLSNAVKFTPVGGTVTLECEADEKNIVIRVCDTGPGIPAEKLQSVFEPFVQIDRSLTNTGTGVGLGLSISRDLARRMGGDVTVKSELGKGATFSLTLPRNQ